MCVCVCRYFLVVCVSCCLRPASCGGLRPEAWTITEQELPLPYVMCRTGCARCPGILPVFSKEHSSTSLMN